MAFSIRLKRALAAAVVAVSMVVWWQAEQARAAVVGDPPAGVACDAACEWEQHLASLSLGERAFSIEFVAPGINDALNNAAPDAPWHVYLVNCEQSGNWQATSRSYAGGFGFRYETWQMMRSGWADLGVFVDAWPTMNLAPPWAQTIAARQLRHRYGLAPWPACGRRWQS